MKVPASGQNQRVPVLGAVDDPSREVVRTLLPARNGVTFVRLLEQVTRRWPTGTIVLVLDDVSYHRGAVMRTWWSKQADRLVEFRFPV